VSVYGDLGSRETFHPFVAFPIETREVETGKEDRIDNLLLRLDLTFSKRKTT
jgi:hypothetical protein